MNIKCNQCGYVGPVSEFPMGHDFFQNKYIKACPKCDNHQSPGDASMRMFGGIRPFESIDETPPIQVTDRESAITEVIRRHTESVS